MHKPFDLEKQRQLTEEFHALHHADEPLILVNAWDALSAKIIENSGFPAIATTSSGISWSLGYKDGERTPPQLMLDTISRISRVVDIPVSADIEGGYFRNNLDLLTWFIQETIETGAVGINLEDGYQGQEKLNEPDYQIREIKVIRKVAKEKGVNLFINARTDAMEKGAGDKEDRIQNCLNRAKKFEEAGADGIFIPFVPDIETVARFKKAIPLPLNILMTKSLDVSQLKELKVNRISVGGKPKLVLMNRLMQLAQTLKTSNNWDSLFVDEPNHPQANSWF